MRYLGWIVTVAVALLIWYVRTWFHSPIMLLFTRPYIIQWMILSVIICILLRRIPWLTAIRTYTSTDKGKEVTYKYNWYPWVCSTIVILLFVPMLLMGIWGRGAYLGQNVEYEFIDSLPDSGQGIRLMPYDVAYRYAKDSLQLSQYRLGTENIVLKDDTLHWVFPLVPDGLVIKFLNKNMGIVEIDATTQDRSSAMVEQQLEIGERMQITDNLWWNLFRERFFVTTEDPYYIATDGDIYTVVPAIEYRFKFYWGIIHTVPEFAGLFLVSSDGSIDFLTPEQAEQHPVTAGNRIFPELLAREYVHSYQYHLGVINKLFIHEDQIQIQDVAASVRINKQPFLITTEDGPMWFVGTEPHGASHGIFKIFLIDAITGTPYIYELSQQETLTGPNRAANYIRRANPIVDWSRFTLVEPLPFIRNGTLYWKLAVVPSDGAGIAYQAFVDASTNEVFETRTDEEIEAFIAGRLDQITPVDDPSDQSTTIELIRQKLTELIELIDQLDVR